MVMESSEIDESPFLIQTPQTYHTGSTHRWRQSTRAPDAIIVRPICDTCSRTRDIGQDCHFCEMRADYEESSLEFRLWWCKQHFKHVILVVINYLHSLAYWITLIMMQSVSTMTCLMKLLM